MNTYSYITEITPVISVVGITKQKPKDRDDKEKRKRKPTPATNTKNDSDCPNEVEIYSTTNCYNANGRRITKYASHFSQSL